MGNKIYSNIGLFKNILICLYDLMLLFSVLFFMSIPIHIFTNGDTITNNPLYQKNKTIRTLGNTLKHLQVSLNTGNATEKP